MAAKYIITEMKKAGSANAAKKTMASEMANKKMEIIEKIIQNSIIVAILSLKKYDEEMKIATNCIAKLKDLKGILIILIGGILLFEIKWFSLTFSRIFRVYDLNLEQRKKIKI
jgi:hypothetical protein